jgi:hypothetical protein
MNMNYFSEIPNLDKRSSFVATCKGACRKLLARLETVKTSLLREFRQTTFNQDRLLQLALNEAEALAYETGFPHLTFPMLAREKVQAVAAWGRHQNRVRRESFRFAA